MTLSDVITRYLLSEESIMEIREDEIAIEEFKTSSNINVGTRVIIIGKNGRKRLVDLGLLQIIVKCGYLEFVRDYLDMRLSLKDIYAKYRTYTELEYLSIHEGCIEYNNDKDLQYALAKVRLKVMNRVNEENSVNELYD